jgi:cytochrome P450
MSKTTLKRPPMVSGKFFLGNLFQMKNEGVGFYTRVAQEYGDAVRAKIGWKEFNVFFHPDQIEDVLSLRPDIFIKGKQYDQLRHILGQGLLTSEGAEWEKHRRLLNPIFGKVGLDILLVQINETSKKFVANLDSSVEIDWTRKMFDFSLEVAMSAFFGSNLDHTHLNQMAYDTHQCMRFVSKRMTNPINIPLLFPLPSHIKFKKSLGNIKKQVEQIYNNKFQKLKDNNESSKDMMDLLINAQDEDKFRLSKTQVFDQIMSFLIAGHETTALSLSWLFYLLAQNEQYQDKLIEEFESQNYEFIGSLDIIKYPFLNAVIDETLRLYPAGWIIARNSAQDDQVSGFRVKKNQVVAVCPFVAHRDPRFWERPLDFYPERFLDKETIKKLPRGAYVPFSIGRRNCIGARFSTMEMMAFVITFFKNFKIHTELQEVGVKGFATLKADRPITVKLRPRNEKI